MRILSLKRLAPYGVAVLSVTLATIVRLELDPLLGEIAPLLIFAIAVILTSWLGGFWPGALATGLSLLIIDYLFFAPKYSIFSYDSRLDQIRAVSFGIFGMLFSLISARLRENIKAERGIRERFRLLVEGVKDYAIYMLDAQGRVDSWNPGAEQIKGYRANEIIGRDISVFYTPEDIESGKPQRVLEVAAAEGSYHESGWQVRKDGSRFWASGVIAAIHDDREKLRGFTIITRDITERKMIEEKILFLADLNQALRPLADPEEIMAAAAQMLGEYLGVDRCAYAEVEMLYRFGYLAECNDAMARMYGYESADQLVGARISDLLPRSDPRNIAYLRALKRSGYRLTDAETYEVDRRGNAKYFLSNQIGIVENEAVVRSWGIQRDITERKQAEEALRESEEQARRQLAHVEAIYATAPVGLCFVGADFRFLSINERLAEIDGRSVEEHMGRTVREVIPEMADTVEPVLRRVIETGEPAMNVEQSGTTAREPGVIRHFIASYYPIKNGGGKAFGVNAVVMEITERKKIEEELERLLREEKSAREEAEAANRMKDEFLATISHELRTPLTSILGWARILTGGELTAPQTRHALEVITQSAQSQTQLIEDILDTSRIIAGRFTLDTQPVAIEHIFHAAVDVVRPSAEAKGIVLNEVVEAPDSVVLCDANRLQQAIWNLLSNAVKFTNEGGRIEARLGSAEGQVEIAVKDTGIGIEPRFLPHVFDRFRQADASSTREYGGLGIGLAIVRHVVEMHGGGVSASSPGKGQGATFRIRLPLISASRLTQPEGPRVEATMTKEPEVLEDGYMLEGVRVLLVEDNPDTLDMLKFIFDESGAEVITATSVDEALDALERFKPDALVSDIAMPDRDGYELIREIRSREPERGGKIPAVAVTAYARAEDRVRALTAGFQMHITKPISPDELITVVASLTGHMT